MKIRNGFVSNSSSSSFVISFKDKKLAESFRKLVNCQVINSNDFKYDNCFCIDVPNDAVEEGLFIENNNEEFESRYLDY